MDWTNVLTRGKRIIDWLKSKDPLLIVIFILFAIIAFQRLFPKVEYKDRVEYKDKLVYVDKVVTHYDTIVKNIYKDKFVYDTIVYTEIDSTYLTEECLRYLHDYFATKIITDTLANDTALFATAKYTLQKNAIIGRNFNYKSRVKTEIINNVTVVNEPKNKVYATLGVGGGINRFEIEAGLMFQNTKDRTVGVTYDPVNKEIMVGTSFKLFQYGKFKRD